MLFGPAYKGIPLVTVTAAALADHHDLSLPFAFNRKEAKAHGEGGTIVGAPLTGRVLIIDDVITAGTAIRESIDIIRAARQPDGRWLQGRPHPGRVWFEVDVPENEPSKWVTLYALRVLAWWDSGPT